LPRHLHEAGEAIGVDVVEIPRRIDPDGDQEGVDLAVPSGIVRCHTGGEAERAVADGGPEVGDLVVGGFLPGGDARGRNHVHEARRLRRRIAVVLRCDRALLLERGAAEIEAVPSARGLGGGDRVGFGLRRR